MSRSRHWQIESHHAPLAPGLHTDERRCVPFPRLALARDECTERSSALLSADGATIVRNKPRQSCSLLALFIPRPSFGSDSLAKTSIKHVPPPFSGSCWGQPKLY